MRGRSVAAIAGLLLASPARADNCAGFGDCGGVLAATLAAAGLAVLIAFVVQLLPLLVSLAVDVSPLGRARGIAEAITGIDMLTGQRLSFLERALGVLPGGRTARAARAGATAKSLAKATRVDTAHLAELTSKGVKFTPDKVLATGKDASGRVVFLEVGDEGAGLRHITNEHGSDFAKVGIGEADIPETVMRAVTEGKLVGYQGRGTGRPIYEISVGDKTRRIAVTIGDNGYIVGANPTGAVR